MTEGRGEFELIERFFAPLAGPEGLALGDDAALVPGPPAGEVLAVTCDTMVAGTHFLPRDAPDALGHKLLAVNLSDLAAMGATPMHYLLAVSWPAVPTDEWLAAFTAGLARIQRDFGITLVGGDTTRIDGPLTLTVTAFGHVAPDKALRRSKAHPGDRLFVSGTVGDAALGLHISRDGLAVVGADRAALVERLQRPTPRVALGQALAGIASAAMDVSDGLIGDLGHIAAQSGVGAVVETARVPLSAAATSVLADEPDLLTLVLSGGDDYELLFTAPPDRTGDVMAAASAAATPVTEIGVIRGEPGVVAVDRDGRPLALDRAGFRHF